MKKNVDRIDLEALYAEYKVTRNERLWNIIYKELIKSLNQNIKLNKFIKNEIVRKELISNTFMAFLTSKYDCKKSRIITYTNTILSNFVYHYGMDKKTKIVSIEDIALKLEDIPDNEGYNEGFTYDEIKEMLIASGITIGDRHSYTKENINMYKKVYSEALKFKLF